MIHKIALIEDLAIILCFAGVTTVLFQKIKQPTVLGYLIAGIIIGPFTPPFSLIDDEAEIKVLAELGVIFLMFSLGLEFSFHKLVKVGLPAVIIAIVEVVTVLLIGYSVGQLIGWSSYESVLLGSALAISSTTIIVKALEELNLKRHYFSELMVGVLLIEDLLAILLLVYLSTPINTEGIFSYPVLITTVQLLLVVTSWFLIGYLFVPILMRRIQNYINHETLTIISVGLCLALSAIAMHFDYSVALGAFIMGSILAETPQAQSIETLTLPIRDIFAAVFFVSVGMLIDPSIIMTSLPLVLFLSIVTIGAKFFGAAFGTLLSGQGVSTAMRIGFSMAQIGEFSFIIIGVGVAMSATRESLYPIIVAISAITTFATPYMIKFSVKFSERAEENLPSGVKTLTDRYAAFLQNLKAKSSQDKFHGKDILRFVINGIVVAIIFLSLSSFAGKHPFYGAALNTAALLVSSPFIWAMLFTSQTSRAWFWSLTAAELTLLILHTTPNPLSLIAFCALLIIVLKYAYNGLKSTYFWFESQLVKNLTSEEEKFNQLAPWDYEIVRLKMLSHFPFIGKTLLESKLRPSFGINILAIKRNAKTIWIPTAQEIILPGDELMILGNKYEIDQFDDFTQKIEITPVHDSEEELVFTTVIIDENHPLINQTIAESKSREELHGLIISMQRGENRILNPEPNTVLQAGDLLHILTKGQYR